MPPQFVTTCSTLRFHSDPLARGIRAEMEEVLRRGPVPTCSGPSRLIGLGSPAAVAGGSDRLQSGRRGQARGSGNWPPGPERPRLAPIGEPKPMSVPALDWRDWDYGRGQFGPGKGRGEMARFLLSGLPREPAEESLLPCERHSRVHESLVHLRGLACGCAEDLNADRL